MLREIADYSHFAMLQMVAKLGGLGWMVEDDDGTAALEEAIISWFLFGECV